MKNIKNKMVIVIRKDLNMRRGKMCAQAAHATLKFLTDNNESNRNDEIHVELSQLEYEWLFGSMTKIVVGCDSEDELNQLILTAKINNVPVYPIIDAGFTEFHGAPTLTCAAFGPDREEDIDKITGNLKLL